MFFSNRIFDSELVEAFFLYKEASVKVRWILHAHDEVVLAVKYQVAPGCGEVGAD